MFLKIHYAIASGLYSGLMRPFPGTWGSAAAIILWYVARHIVPPGSFLPDIVAICAIILIGTFSTAQVLKAIENGALPAPKRSKDPNFVVIDEWAGMWITLLGTGRADYLWIVICFFLFRALDVVKPAPIRNFEKLPGAWGIMFDDVVAGIIGLIIVTLARAF